MIAILQTRKGNIPTAAYLGIIALTVEAVSLLKPILLKPIFTAFSAFGKIMGWINSKILLTIIFYALITPISFLMKLLRKDLLQQKIDKNASTYWNERKPKEFAPAHYENQF